MPHAIRPGDVLADRYRLVDLLSESGDGRFWRAHDRILERHVALHVIAEQDPRAPGLVDAARRSATVLDPRILRVLDAERSGGLCYVVNEWGDGTSLDIVVATHGPLPPRAAAWLVAELAGALAAGHAGGVAHGRLVPENVLVDRTGAVRVIGFAVDAALHGLPPDRARADLTDLGGVLYCALTGRWTGESASAVPGAPGDPGRPLRPRQVRAGVPRTLDALCDQLLQGPDAGGARLTAVDVAAALADFVGDPTGLPEQLATLNIRPEQTIVLPQVPEMAVRESEPDREPTRVVDRGADRTGSSPVAAEPARPSTPDHDPPPTQAGMPVFDDENDEVSWLTARSVPPPPPPPFEDPPERPLFAPSPADGEPSRRARSSSPGPPPGSDDPSYWPWAGSDRALAGPGGATPVEPVDDTVPGRRALRTAVVLAALVLLVVAVVVAVNVGRGRTPLGRVPDDPTTSTTTPSPTTPRSPTPLAGLTADDLDPQGAPGGESPESVGNAVDGDPATTWRTSTYFQQLGPTGLKTGLGLVVDLGGRQEVADVGLLLVGEPTTVELYLTDDRPADVEGLEPVATDEVGTRGRITLSEPAAGRFLVVWLTALPAVTDGFRGEVAEVSVRG